MRSPAVAASLALTRIIFARRLSGRPVRDDLADPVPRVVGELRVRLVVVRERDEPGAQRPATTADPGLVVDAELGAEKRSCVGGKQVPSDHEIARRIAEAEAS